MKNLFLMGGRGYSLTYPSSPHLSRIYHRVGLSTCLLGAGCYGFVGPIPLTVLDKKKYFNINSVCKDKINELRCNDLRNIYLTT
jgi:hypothetical protein